MQLIKVYEGIKNQTLLLLRNYSKFTCQSFFPIKIRCNMTCKAMFIVGCPLDKTSTSMKFQNTLLSEPGDLSNNNVF